MAARVRDDNWCLGVRELGFGFGESRVRVGGDHSGDGGVGDFGGVWLRGLSETLTEMTKLSGWLLAGCFLRRAGFRQDRERILERERSEFTETTYRALNFAFGGWGVRVRCWCTSANLGLSFHFHRFDWVNTRWGLPSDLILSLYTTNDYRKFK